MFDYWTNRPSQLKTEQPLSRKTCKNHICELGLFFKWLHLEKPCAWRKPEDFEAINRTVRQLPEDRKSIKSMEHKRFSLDDLKAIYRRTTLFERLLLVWSLNCCHGAGESGRTDWEDIYFEQPHPWEAQGLMLNSAKDDSWIGFLRPKSDVLGWRWLFPETVTLLKWWRDSECATALKGVPTGEKRVLITDTGSDLYRDTTKNGQTGFSNAWGRLLNRVEKHESITRHSFGTLRHQLSDWLGGDQNQAILASVALAHGIPHKGDKLLFQHYSNKPWAALFEAQRSWREHLRPMFDELPSVLSEPM